MTDISTERLKEVLADWRFDDAAYRELDRLAHALAAEVIALREQVAELEAKLDSMWHEDQYPCD